MQEHHFKWAIWPRSRALCISNTAMSLEIGFFFLKKKGRTIPSEVLCRPEKFIYVVHSEKNGAKSSFLQSQCRKSKIEVWSGPEPLELGQLKISSPPPPPSPNLVGFFVFKAHIFLPPYLKHTSCLFCYRWRIYSKVQNMSLLFFYSQKLAN